MAKNLHIPVNVDLVQEVAIFKTGEEFKMNGKTGDYYVVRRFGELARLGDDIWDGNPSDEEIKSVYGDVSIHRGYAVAPKKIEDMAVEHLKSGRANITSMLLTISAGIRKNMEDSHGQD